MKIRTDFVTNSSSSSFITITATKKDGSVIVDELENEDFSDEMIYFSSGIEELVNSKTANGDEILKNIQTMYNSISIDYLLDESEEERPLRSIESLNDLQKIEIKEEISGDVMEGMAGINAEGDLVYISSATAAFSYNVETGVYSKKRCYFTNEDGQQQEIFIEKE